MKKPIGLNPTKVIKPTKYTRARKSLYCGVPPFIDDNDAAFPPANSQLGRTLSLMHPIGRQLTHAMQIPETGSHRTSGYIETLRNHYQWPITVKDVDELVIDGNSKRLSKNRAAYELFVELSASMASKFRQHNESVRRFEAGAATPATKAERAGKGYEETKP